MAALRLGAGGCLSAREEFRREFDHTADTFQAAFAQFQHHESILRDLKGRLNILFAGRRVAKTRVIVCVPHQQESSTLILLNLPRVF